LKHFVKIDDPLPQLSRKIRKGYFERRHTITESLGPVCRSYSSYFRLQFRKILLVSVFLIPGIGVVAPDSNTLTILDVPSVNPFADLMYATAMVETMGNILAYNEFENAVGIFQIRQVRIDDFNRRTGLNYRLVDMFNPQLSEQVFLYFASLYGPYELEKISKAWNGSGPRTELYWKRIRKYL
jgi:hypothetical protein